MAPWPPPSWCNSGDQIFGLKASLRDETVDIWYLDEMGIEGDPRPRRGPRFGCPITANISL
jgi:hypothetical protein